jgi:hypothetical protein
MAELEWEPYDDRVGIKRMPAKPSREDFSPEEQADWDAFYERYLRVAVEKKDHKYRHRIAGGFFGLMCSPGLADALTYMGAKVMQHQGRADSFTPYDHELIDQVLSYDSGHWGLIANHAPWAVASGISIETIEALRDGREDELSESDRQVIAYIRGVRDGTVTDEMWEGMVERYGSERGAVELAFLVLVLHCHVRLIQLFDEPQITPEEFEDELELLRRGEYPLPRVAPHPSQTSK